MSNNIYIKQDIYLSKSYALVSSKPSKTESTDCFRMQVLIFGILQPSKHEINYFNNSKIHLNE